MTTRKTHTVSKLSLDELSLVDNPANPGARSVLFKRSDVRPSLMERVKQFLKGDAKTFDQVRAKSEFGQKIWPLMDAMSCSVKDIMEDSSLSEDQRAGLLDQSVQEFREALKELPLLKGHPGDHGDHTSTQEDAVTLDEAMAKIKELEEKLAGAGKGDVSKGHEPEPDLTLADVDPAAAVALAKVQSENEDLRKRLEAAETRELLRTRMEKARSIAGTVPVDHGKLANILTKLSDEDVAVVEGLFKSHAQALADLNLMKEIGEVSDLDGSAEQQLELEIGKAMTANPNLTREQAVSKVLDRNPHLYEAVTAAATKGD